MENKQIVTVFTTQEAKVVELTGFSQEDGKGFGGPVEIGDIIQTTEAKRRGDGLVWESAQLHPEFIDGHRCWVNPITISTNHKKEAVEVAFLLAPNIREHKASERAWVRRVILSTDTEVILQTADDVVSVKAGDLKAGDKLINPGKALDEEFDVVDHNVMVLDVKPLGEMSLTKVEFEVSEDCDTIWISGVPFQDIASREAFEEWTNEEVNR